MTRLVFYDSSFDCHGRIAGEWESLRPAGRSGIHQAVFINLVAEWLTVRKESTVFYWEDCELKALAGSIQYHMDFRDPTNALLFKLTWL